METSIKTDLFRFATLRNPQLLSDEEKDTAFIFPPSGVAVPPAGSIPSVFNSLEEVKAANPGLYALGRWLAKNRRNHSFTFAGLANRCSSVAQLAADVRSQIWERLLQEVTNGKPGPLREALIQLLVADHFLAFFNIASDGQPQPDSLYADYYATANAKVVLPQDEMEQIRQPKSATQPGSFIDMQALDTRTKVTDTLNTLNTYQVAIAELLAAGKVYETDTAAAYQQAISDFERNWVLYVDSLTLSTDESTGEVFRSRDYTSGADRQVIAFEPEKLFSLSYLEGRVTPATISVVTELKLDTYTSMPEAISAIEARMQQLGSGFTTADGKEKTIIFNGLIWEINEADRIPEAPTDVLYGYRLCSYYNTGSHSPYFDIQLNAGYNTTSATACQFTFTDAQGNQSISGNFGELSSGGYNINLRLTPISGLTFPANIAYRIQGTITLFNGKVVAFDETLKPGTCQAGIGRLAGSGQAGEAGGLIGIHQLGIADYRKITQEVCCYVPGEVSHIENVLKGEYKERATRRLLRTEDTTETAVDRETENLTDVSSTERNEMHSEVSKVLATDKSITANASLSGSIPYVGSFSAGAGYTSNTAQTDSTSQAIGYAKDVTTRAMERVVQKISEKRTRKMIDEYEENNKHGLDNRGIGAQNVSGIYRWVDKVYKNQLVNYGRRLMYEIMVPEPARFLSAGAATAAAAALQVLSKPTDPRTLVAHAGLLTTANYQYLAAQYSATVAACPAAAISVSKAVKMECTIAGPTERQALAEAMDIPDGYAATSARAALSYYYFPDRMEECQVTVNIGNYQYASVVNQYRINTVLYAYAIGDVEKELAIGVRVTDLSALSLTVVADCRLTATALQQWQAETYQAILDAYNDQKTAYENALANAQAGTAATRYNPLQSRMIENGELKKNCLQLLLEPFGNTIGVNTLKPDSHININAVFGTHAAKVRFFEAAFEWEIMSYIFYPYFWADEAQWNTLFALQDADPLFRSFLQAGMAKVVLSVRPGYEEAVMYYLETGRINEGKDLAVADDTYLSLLAEQLPIDGLPEGEPWETRLPTTLTVLQNDSIAVTATGLPCACDDTPGANGFTSNTHTLVYAAASIGGTGVNGL